MARTSHLRRRKERAHASAILALKRDSKSADRPRPDLTREISLLHRPSRATTLKEKHDGFSTLAERLVAANDGLAANLETLDGLAEQGAATQLAAHYQRQSLITQKNAADSEIIAWRRREALYHGSLDDRGAPIAGSYVNAPLKSDLAKAEHKGKASFGSWPSSTKPARSRPAMRRGRQNSLRRTPH